MFLSELTPIMKEAIQSPIAFLGGFCSGVLKLNLTEEPLATWLQKQGNWQATKVESTKNNGPQSISIE